MRSALFGILFCLLATDVSGQVVAPTPTGGVGAVYTMSNGAMMNQVYIYRLNSTGQLTFAGLQSTNGTGINTTAQDVLKSQGSMMVYSNYLFVINSGSNSLSMFSINTADATQLTLVSVQPTNGWFPISVAVNSQYACVLTGGNQTGIRCFTYNASGLYAVPSFDRNLTSYISQTVPPLGPSNTFSQIQFSADNLCLIIAAKGVNASAKGYLLFYSLIASINTLVWIPALQTPPNGILPSSMTLVGANGLLIADPGAQGVLTLTYSSANGAISNNGFTGINASIAGAPSYSAYSPTIGNYYVLSEMPAAIVELKLNLSSNSTPAQIIQYYPLSNNTGALEPTIVTLAGVDYLYFIGSAAQVINGYQLNGPGNATANQVVTVQNRTDVPKIAGLAAYVQTSSSSSTMPTSTMPTSEISTSETPTSETPTSEMSTSEMSTSEIPTSEISPSSTMSSSTTTTTTSTPTSTSTSTPTSTTTSTTTTPSSTMSSSTTSSPSSAANFLQTTTIRFWSTVILCLIISIH